MCTIWLSERTNLSFITGACSVSFFLSPPHEVINKVRIKRKLKLFILCVVCFLIIDNGFANAEIQRVHAVQKLLPQFNQLNVGTDVNTLIVDELQQTDITFLKIGVCISI